MTRAGIARWIMAAPCAWQIACSSGQGASDGAAGDATRLDAAARDGQPDGTSRPSGDATLPSTDATVPPGTPYYVLDLRALYTQSPTALDDRRTVFDTLVAATSLQGLVNRDGPSLYLDFAQAAPPSSAQLDEVWLRRIASDPAIGRGLLDGRTAVALASLDAAFDTFASHVHGLVVWDENVPATVNAGYTVAGADDLVPVRWDASPTSLYARLRARGLPVGVWLVHEDGTALFHDGPTTDLVPDTTRHSTGCAKDDVYLWLIEHYQQMHRLDPTEYGYTLDSVWLQRLMDSTGSMRPAGLIGVTNHDYLVAHRGFAFDLSPWAGIPATDAPHQTPGLDRSVWTEILTHGREQADASHILSIRGFIPWEYKYTSEQGLTPTETYLPAHGEWETAALISPFAAGLDADGLAPMANASFYQWVSRPQIPAPQPRATPEDLVGQGYLSGLGDNGGFEAGSSGWSLHASNEAVITDSATTGPRAHSGLRYLECNSSSASANSISHAGGAVTAGTPVTLRAFIRSPGAPVTVNVAVFALDDGTEQASQHFTATRTWSEVRVTLIPHASHASTRAQFYLDATGADLDLDDVAFYAGDAAAGHVVPANYMLWYVGDYDSSAWMYRQSANTWDSPGRGIVPFAWPVSTNAATRFPVFFNYVLQARTARDYFIGADSGPAYGNPGVMDAPAREIWRTAGMRGARDLDTSIGWSLDPRDALDATHATALTPFFGDGVLLTSFATGHLADGSVVDNTPFIALSSCRDVASITALTATPTTPQFTACRTTQGGAPAGNNVALVTTTHDLLVDHAAGAYRFVDPFTFFALARHRSGARNTHRASYTALSIDPPTVGQPVHVTVTLRNDGWDTWSAAGSAPYHVGFAVTAAPAPVRSLPHASGAMGYATRATLPHDVAPGEGIVVTATLPALAVASAHTLQVDVVEEGAAWFESDGDVPLQVGLAAR